MIRNLRSINYRNAAGFILLLLLSAMSLSVVSGEGTLRRQGDQPRVLLPWDIHFIQQSSRAVYTNKRKEISINFTKTAIREDMIITVFERGCQIPVFPVPGDDDRSIVSNIRVVSGSKLPNSTDNQFRTIVELHNDIESTPLFFIHDNDEATLEFCLKVDLVVPNLDSGEQNVSINFAQVAYRMQLLRDPNTDKFKHHSSFTSRYAMALDL